MNDPSSNVNIIRRQFYNTIIDDSDLRELKHDSFLLDLSYDRKELKPIIEQYGGIKKSLRFNWNPLALNDSRWKEHNKDVIAGVKATIEAAKVARINKLEAKLKANLSPELLVKYNSKPSLSNNSKLLNNQSSALEPDNFIVGGGRTRRQKRVKAATRRRH